MARCSLTRPVSGTAASYRSVIFAVVPNPFGSDRDQALAQRARSLASGSVITSKVSGCNCFMLPPDNTSEPVDQMCLIVTLSLC
jgi:hypothetical protein